ncbi:ribonuclease HII [Subtercola sp. YIM 133946]|uniref:ribonuclease HII n=1 Tax=Subtercola sp. YIM 133946 TaxID=3118909 RepID=UPI002F9450D5
MTPVSDPTLKHERALGRQGARLVIGVDEVGRGALAGPVAVGMCVIDPVRPGRFPVGLRDSKLLAEPRREQLAPLAAAWARASAVGLASANEVDELGIMVCLGLAGARAFALLLEAGVDVSGAVLVLDGNYDYLSRHLPVAGVPASAAAPAVPPLPVSASAAPPAPSAVSPLPVSASAAPSAVPPPYAAAGGSEGPSYRVTTRIKADRDCASVAAASVVAKVHRDRLMIDLDAQVPGYGWASNKGYSSSAHFEALDLLGPSAHHRLTWLKSERMLVELEQG